MTVLSLKSVDQISIPEEWMSVCSMIEDSSDLFFITGKAGTGKTTFLNYLYETSEKNRAVLAPTGIAAVNAGGSTIHSFFRINPTVFFHPGHSSLNKSNDNGEENIYKAFAMNINQIRVLRKLELLIIDEISMVRADLLDIIDRLLRVHRNREHLPFGGVQVVMIGDLYQLPPVINGNLRKVYFSYYRSPYFFDSEVLRKFKPTVISFEKVYRQTDRRYVDLLSRVRSGMAIPEDKRLLDSLMDRRDTLSDDEVFLSTHNATVDRINRSAMDNLPGDPWVYSAEIFGNFPENMMPNSCELELKKGAQVMFIRNSKGPVKDFYNGMIGTVLELSEDSVRVSIPGGFVDVYPSTWENIRYEYNSRTDSIESVTIGTFTQLPLKAAWAVTVHKSQGMTFDRVRVDVQYAFDTGQIYVALSRCRSLDGLRLYSPVDLNMTRPDRNVQEFMANAVKP